MDPNRPGITELLNTGDTPADSLWETVYPELRRRATNLLKSERSDHTLSPTAVLHETYLRLATRTARDWQDRAHFYATASGIMRHVLIDHARARTAEKRGGGEPTRVLDESVFADLRADDHGWIVARDTLDALAETHERAASVVVLRVFGGLSVSEVAGELGVSERTVKTDWSVAKERVSRLLSDTDGLAT